MKTLYDFCQRGNSNYMYFPNYSNDKESGQIIEYSEHCYRECEKGEVYEGTREDFNQTFNY